MSPISKVSRLRNAVGSSCKYSNSGRFASIVGPYGTCRAAAHRNEIVVTCDIEHDPGWAKLKEYPLAIQLRAAWSCPIRAADGRVLRTLATYFRACRAPRGIERDLVPMLARTTAIAIERTATTFAVAAGGN